MGGLSDISSVKVIMVGHLLAVVILERHQERDQSLVGYLEGVHKTALLLNQTKNAYYISWPTSGGISFRPAVRGLCTYFENGVRHGRQRSIAGQFRYSENVNTPAVDFVQKLQKRLNVPDEMDD